LGVEKGLCKGRRVLESDGLRRKRGEDSQSVKGGSGKPGKNILLTRKKKKGGRDQDVSFGVVTISMGEETNRQKRVQPDREEESRRSEMNEPTGTEKKNNFGKRGLREETENSTKSRKTVKESIK